MDQAQLLELARQTLLYLSPLIAAGALARVGEDGVDATKKLAQKTWKALQSRVAGNDEAEAALTLYKAKPDDTGRQQMVEGEIVRILDANPVAVSELSALVAEARTLGLIPQQVATRIHNQHISGDAQVGVAISGDVQGGITAPAMPSKHRTS